MTPRELDLCYKGRRKAVIEQWEMVRTVSYYSLLPHQGKKSKKLKFKDINLPIDQEIESMKKRVPRKIKYAKVTFLTDKYGAKLSRD